MDDYDSMRRLLEFPIIMDDMETDAYISGIINRYIRGEITEESEEFKKLPKALQKSMPNILTVRFSKGIFKI